MTRGMSALRLAVATSSAAPGINADDAQLVQHLHELRICAVPAVWNDPGVDWQAFDAVLIRSTWDYHRHYAAFLAWLERLESLRVRTINAQGLLRWNSDKRYLLQLDQIGIAVIPTRTARKGQLPEVLASMHGADTVVKPIVSAGAWHTVRGIAGSAAMQDALAQLPAELEYLVQPFIPEVASDGEWSLLFFGGAYSHAVCKLPSAGDYRVQREFGGQAAQAAPAESIITEAQGVLDAVEKLARDMRLGTPTYARIDGVWRRNQLLIMEVELIEPFLFLSSDAAASGRFAAAIARELGASELLTGPLPS